MAVMTGTRASRVVKEVVMTSEPNEQGGSSLLRGVMKVSAGVVVSAALVVIFLAITGGRLMLQVDF
jgi:hypothetical protein